MQERLNLQQLQVEMRVNHEGLGVLLLCDNQSSMKIAQNPVFHKRSKLIAIWCHFIWEKAENGEWRDGTSVCEDHGNGGRLTYQECWFASFDGQDGFDGYDWWLHVDVAISDYEGGCSIRQSIVALERGSH